MDRIDPLIERLEQLLEQVQGLLPAPPREIDWSAQAYRWRNSGLKAVRRPHRIRLDDLLCMERQKAEMVRNTRQFMSGLPANNILLWGSRGTGKSSLIKAVFEAFREQGLRLIEVEPQDLIDLPDIVDCIAERPDRFIIYCDDLSFEADDTSYKALKAVLDGCIIAPPENLLIYASSNRRHLLPEFHSENRDARIVDGEIHHGESVEEKVSLSERFGLWLSFHPFNQAQYLSIVRHWLERLEAPGNDSEEMREQALKWALLRGSRSGRVAWQFSRDWAGRQGQFSKG